jgi:4-hydroxybenzoate polyprenyltransferase
MGDIVKLLRPRQWIKNVFVFAGLIFSRHFFYGASIIQSIIAFLLFCMLSSGVYILNDILDYEEDRMHPGKKERPIAAGTITRRTGVILAFAFMGAALVGAYLAALAFFYTCLIYAILMVLYSSFVKKVIILDVLFVAAGYVLRAIAGAVVIEVEISPWLLLCTLLLALFLAISKRRSEIMRLGDMAVQHRKTLAGYSINLLNQMIGIVTSACIVSYCLYTLAPETTAKFGTRSLLYTVPFVIYGVFRYLYLTYSSTDAESPEKIITGDKPLLICLVLWAVLCVVILISV